MKVFMCKRSGGYSGGLAVVAANSKEEAFKVFHTGKYEWMLDCLTDDGEYSSNIDDVDSDYYKRQDWFEVPNLIANVDKPCVIEQDGYSE